jgi:hypothetical protein
MHHCPDNLEPTNKARQEQRCGLIYTSRIHPCEEKKIAAVGRLSKWAGNARGTKPEVFSQQYFFCSSEPLEWLPSERNCWGNSALQGQDARS